jgi:hypothetical protein
VRDLAFYHALLRDAALAIGIGGIGYKVKGMGAPITDND